MRSLPKNLTSLNDLILTVKETPEIIAILETKLQNENIYNISILGYVFSNNNSLTRAGGVSLYISHELNFIRRRDLEITSDRIELCWVEIRRQKEKNIVHVIGCSYRHPANDCAKLHNALKEQLSNLNNKNKVFVLGDFWVTYLITIEITKHRILPHHYVIRRSREIASATSASNEWLALQEEGCVHNFHKTKQPVSAI